MDPSLIPDGGHRGPNNFTFLIRKKNIHYIAIVCFVFGVLFRSAHVVEILLDLIFQFTSVQLNVEFRTAGFAMTGSSLVLFGFLFLLFKMTGGNNTILSHNQFYHVSVFAILLFYWNTLFNSMVNIPITDDCFTVLNFLNSYIHLTEVLERWDVIYAPYVETRNVITKVMVITMWKITGVINFKGFILLINLALSGIGYLLYLSLYKITWKEYLVIPMLLFVFQFSYYDAQLWTTAGIHIVFTMFFAFASFYLLDKKTTGSFAWAILLACLAVFTYGNGLFVFPVGLVILLQGRQTVQWRIWVLIFIAVLLCYFIHYRTVRSAVDYITANPFLLIAWCLAFWGSAFQFMYRPELPVLVGSLFFLLFIWLTKKKYFLLNPFNYCMMLYVVLSAVMASFFRITDEQGIQQALSNRYVLYSVIATWCCIIALAEMNMEWFRRKMLAWVYVSVASYVLMSAFFFFPEVVIRKNKLSSYVEAVKKNLPHSFSSPVIPNGADTIIRRAILNDIYRP